MIQDEELKLYEGKPYTKRQLRNIDKELPLQSIWCEELLIPIIRRFLWEKNKAEQFIDKYMRDEEAPKQPGQSEKTNEQVLKDLIKITDKTLQVWNTLRYDHTSLLSNLITSTETLKAFEGWRDNAKLLNKDAKRALSPIDKRGGRPHGRVENPLRNLLIKELIEFYKKLSAEKQPSRRAYRFMRACLEPLEKKHREFKEVNKIRRALNKDVKDLWSSQYPYL